jgi:hypothetical protein
VLRLHLPFVVGVAGCLYAGWFELTRARAGREVAWVYAVEWPMFAILGTYIWWRLLHEGPARLPVVPDDPHAIDRLDPGLVAWQEYLAALEASDPPGGPPPKAISSRPAGSDSRRRPPGRAG